MRVAFRGYWDKGIAFAQAIEASPHDLVPLGEPADVLLADYDYAELCDQYERVVIYPHGANVISDWATRPVHPNVVMVLVHGVGHVEAMAMYGINVPVVPVGWSYSPLGPIRAHIEPHTVLFGPAHPLGNGRIDPALVDLNARVIEALFAHGFDVTVRSWGEGSDSRAKGWTKGGDLTYADIDRHDLVIADGTLLALAVARGAQCVTFGSMLPIDCASEGDPLWATRFPYTHVRYPLDFDDCELPALIGGLGDPSWRAACAKWRDRFVGGVFQPDLVVKLIESVA